MLGYRSKNNEERLIIILTANTFFQFNNDDVDIHVLLLKALCAYRLYAGI